MNTKLLGELIGRLLHLVTQAHVRHLGNRSYARHMALEGVYTALGDLTDTLCESCQGKYGLLPINAPYVAPTDDLAILQGIATYLETTSKTLQADDWVQNQIQEIQKVIYQGIYKIRFLA